MSSPRSAKCLFCTFTRSIRNPRPRAPYRPFHTSQTLRRGTYGSDSNGRPPKVIPDTSSLAQKLEPYTETEKADLRSRYTPSQLAAIEAGEASLDPKDIVEQGKIREDNYALEYLDDLSQIDDVVDKPIRAPYENHDPNLRLKTDEEIDQDVAEFVMHKFNEEGDGTDVEEFMANLRLTVGKEAAELNPRSFLAPTIPTLPGRDGKTPKSQTADGKKKRDKGKTAEEDEITPEILRLMQATGLDFRQLKRIRCKPLVTHRVVNQTRLGKIRSLYVLSVAGNMDGLIGIGEGKSAEMESAVQQSRAKAIRNMQPVLRYERRTIFGDVEGKVGAVELKLYNRPPGFGIRCQQYIHEIAKCAGIHDLAARVNRSRNPMNTVKAAVQALLKQKDPEDIARARGKKLVDVRKVYYAGNQQ